jgi:Tfp pilus assembly protein PilF
MEMFKALGLLYIRPFAAIGKILDGGSFWTALSLAIGVMLLYAVPSVIEMRAVLEQATAEHPQAASNAPSAGTVSQGNPDADFEDQPLPGRTAATSFMTGMLLQRPFSLLLLLAVVFVPAIVIVTAQLEGSASPGVAMHRDYMPVLVCHLMAWTAAGLPLALAQWVPAIRHAVGAGGIDLHTVVWIAALALFGLLSVCIMRTVGGTGFGRAAGGFGGAAVASVAGFWLTSAIGFVPYYFASPYLLFYLYRSVGGEVRSWGGGLSARQRMRQLLETSTINPRDADAHYQLGLIYQQRHDFAQAKPRFERALQIDASEADPHFQLGKILREEGQPGPALEHLGAAAAIDPKHSSSEVWREIGASLIALGRHPEALKPLEEYTNRRQFDPEGLYWYGVALATCGDAARAREAFQGAIEAVRTAPSHRRRQISKWESLASKEMRTLK